MIQLLPIAPAAAGKAAFLLGCETGAARGSVHWPATVALGLAAGRMQHRLVQPQGQRLGGYRHFSVRYAASATIVCACSQALLYPLCSIHRAGKGESQRVEDIEKNMKTVCSPMRLRKQASKCERRSARFSSAVSDADNPCKGGSQMIFIHGKKWESRA